jgi:hypothetical protein
MAAADLLPRADGGSRAADQAGIGAARSSRGVTAMTEFENNIYTDADRLAILENRAAELERLLLLVTRPEGDARPNVAVPSAVPKGGKRHAGAFKSGGSGGGAPAADGRTEALINRGRPGSRRPRRRRLLAHWRLIVAGMVALLTGVVVALVATRGSGATWPASVATVQAELEQACANPDVAAEPSGLNFACAKDTNQVLWVFALLSRPDLLHRERADRAGPGEQGGELPAVHRLGDAGYQAGLPGRMRVAGYHRVRAGGASERRVRAMDGRHPGPDREGSRRAVRERRQSRQPPGPSHSRQPARVRRVTAKRLAPEASAG